MINYSTTDNQREKIYYWIAAISMSLSSLLLLLNIEFVYKIVVPSVFLIYGLLILLVDKFIWKIKWLEFYFKIPNINGTWTGVNELSSGVKEELSVIITQTWRRIDIIVKTDETVSNVISGTLNTDNDNYKFIKYIYTIRSINPAANNNHYGEGCTELRIEKNDDKILLIGDYFSSKFRGGRFKLEKNASR